LRASLYETDEQVYGLTLARGEEIVTAGAATPEEAAKLDLRPGAPLLIVARTTYLDNNQPIERAVVRSRPDRYQYAVTLHWTPAEPRGGDVRRQTRGPVKSGGDHVDRDETTGFNRTGDHRGRFRGLGDWWRRVDLRLGSQDDASSIRALLHAAELGVNWIDTAPVYGYGRSEEVVGRALAADAPGDRPLIFSKCGMLWTRQTAQGPITDPGAGIDPPRV